MLRKFFTFMWSLLGIAALVLISWALVMYMAWPLWALIPVFIGVLVLCWLLNWSYRRWQSWRLARRLAKDQPQTQTQINHSLIDQQWKNGLAILRQARLGGRSSSLYALPWLLSIQVGQSSQEDDFRSLAIRKSVPDNQQQGLSWYFLKACVILDTPVLDQNEQSDSVGVATWRRLLYHLLRNRRREPLNGLLINIDANFLLNASEHDLIEMGKSLRAQHDDITRVFNVRVPVWLVISGASVIPGFDAWARFLGDDLSKQAFGYSSQTSNNDNQGSIDFLQQAFASLKKRLAELRLALGQQNTLDQDAFELPETIAAMQANLASIFVPAFDSTPYAATPMLRGLYWCSSIKNANNITQTNFTQGLYEDIFPKQRGAWLALSQFSVWRRVFKHIAFGLWSAACIAAVFGLWFSAKTVSNEIDALKFRHLEALNFDGSLESDLQSLNIWHNATERLINSNQGLNSLLPYHNKLDQLANYYKSGFVTLYQKEVRNDYMDKLVVDDLPYTARNGTEIEVAAWAQYLVRRINMVRARLEHKPLNDLPQPGPGLVYLKNIANLDNVGIQTGTLIGSLYQDYLLWQNETTALQGELDGLLSALGQLGLSSRNTDWLIAWADIQSNIRPITLSDFWGVPVPKNAPTVPAGLTSEGTRAISEFAKELVRATGDEQAWQQGYTKMAERFRDASFSSWYRFVSSFNEGKQYLDTENNWEVVLSSTLTTNDPYWLLLDRLNALYDEVPISSRPAWLKQAVTLYHVIAAAEHVNTDNQGVIEQLRSVNALGNIGFKNISNGASVVDSIESMVDGSKAIEEVQKYGDELTKVVKQLLQGKGSAVEVANQTWAYGYDPDVTESALHDANSHLTHLHDLYTSNVNSEDAIWKIIGGPLSFVVDFTARKTACSLQSDWESMVLGTVQNVRSPILAYDLLYGERGSIPIFLDDVVKNFVNRDALRFYPRESLGETIPLSGEFYAYASRVQYEQVKYAEQQLLDENRNKQTENRLADLKEDQAEIEDKLKEQANEPAMITISNSAPLLNDGAKTRPQRIRLSQQCATGLNTLENYNFPAQAVFQWDPKQCQDVELLVDFPGFSLEKNYPGKYGLVEFLRDFSSGQHTFTPSDFPAQAMSLKEVNIDKIIVRWGIKGADGVLESADQTKAAEDNLAEIKAEIKNLKGRENTKLQQQSSNVIEVKDVIPERIVNSCWKIIEKKKKPVNTTTPVYIDKPDQHAAKSVDVDTQPDKAANAAAAAKSSTVKPASAATKGQPTAAKTKQTSTASKASNIWSVQIGIFADPSKVKQSLEKLNISYEQRDFRSKNGKTLFNIVSTGYTDHDDALDVANKIAAELKLQPQVIKKR